MALGLAGACTELLIVWVSGELVIDRGRLTSELAEMAVMNIEGAAAIAAKRADRSS